MEFKTYKLEDALEYIIDYRGKTPKKSDVGIVTLSAKSVKDGYIDYSQCYHISPEEYAKFMVRGFPRIGDVLLTTEAPLGAVARLDREDVALAQRLLTLRGKENVLDTGYLYYFLKSSIGQNKLREKETGTTVTGIKQAEFRKILISLPRLEIQQKISSILSAIDDKIALNMRINDNLQQQARTIFKEWFIENPASNNWDLGVFAELITETISGDWGKDTPHGNNSKMVYCIRGVDIPDVRAGNKGKMPIRYILPKNYAAKRLVDGDIVVEISGGSPTQSTGRATVISTFLLNRYNKGMVCTNFCKAIKPLPGYSMFVYHYWQYLYDANVFFSYENGTTGIKNLDISGFMDMESIRIPPPALVSRFDSFCKGLLAKIYSNGLENEYLTSIRDTLLPRLMSGELDVSDMEL